MHMLSRANGTFAFVVVLTLLLGASIASAETIRLTVSTHINDPELFESQVELMRAFEALHPGVEVEVWYTPWDQYHDQLLAMYLGGTGPDVASIGRFELASFIESGLIQPLDRYMAADPTFDLGRDVIPALMESGLYAGEVYGFPIYNGPAQLYYNEEMFLAAGLLDPVHYIRQNNWNQEAFVESARRMTQDRSGDGTPDQFGYDGFSTWAPSWVPFVRNQGGDIIGSDGRSALNSPQVIEALEWLNSLHTIHGVTRSPGPGGGDWRSGSVGMAVRWQTSALIEKNLFDTFTMEAALIPAGPAGYAHVAGGVPVTVSSHTAHPELAYEFAKWLATQSGIWKIRGGPPLSWEELRSDEYRSTLAQFKNPDMFELSFTVGDVRPEPQFGIVNHHEVSAILDGILINSIRNQERPVRTAVEEAHRLLNQVLGATGE